MYISQYLQFFVHIPHTTHHPLPSTPLPTDPLSLPPPTHLFLHFYNNFNSSFTSTLNPPPTFFYCIYNNFNCLFTSTLTPPSSNCTPPSPPPWTFFSFQITNSSFTSTPPPPPSPTDPYFHNNFNSWFTSAGGIMFHKHKF